MRRAYAKAMARVKKKLAKALKARSDDKLWEIDELQPEEIPEELKESGAIIVSLRDVRNSIGKDRAQWKLVLEAEYNSLLETSAVWPVRHVPKGAEVLPMKMVLTLKPIPGSTLKKKKARACVCGNFQRKSPADLLYTANIDITSIRLVLAIAAQWAHWGITVMDVVTAFLRAPMPQANDKDAIYVKPPALLEQFKIVAPGTFWKLTKAVYGLRVSPRLWGKERDKQLGNLRIRVEDGVLRFMSSCIDIALWILVADDQEECDHNRTPRAFLLTYVDDFLVIGPQNIRNAIEEEISRIWQIKVTGQVNQRDVSNPDASVTFFVNEYSLASEIGRLRDDSGGVYP